MLLFLFLLVFYTKFLTSNSEYYLPEVFIRVFFFALYITFKSRTHFWFLDITLPNIITIRSILQLLYHEITNRLLKKFKLFCRVWLYRLTCAFFSFIYVCIKYHVFRFSKNISVSYNISKTLSSFFFTAIGKSEDGHNVSGQCLMS